MAIENKLINDFFKLKEILENDNTGNNIEKQKEKSGESIMNKNEKGIKIEWVKREVEIREAHIKLENDLEMKAAVWQYPNEKPPVSSITVKLSALVNGKTYLESANFNGDVQKALSVTEKALESVIVRDKNEKVDDLHEYYNEKMSEKFKEIRSLGDKYEKMDCVNYDVVYRGMEERLQENVKKVLSTETMGGGCEKVTFIDNKNRKMFRLELVHSATERGNDRGVWYKEIWDFPKNFNAKSKDNFLEGYKNWVKEQNEKHKKYEKERNENKR